MEVRLLGSLEVGGDDGRPVGVAGGRQRTLLALLALRPGAIVPAERLIDDLWGDRAPQQPGNALQVAVFKLRRTVGADVIVTRPPGYSLSVVPEDVDAVRFERLVQDGRAALGEGRAGTAIGCFDEALGLWRGDALVEFGDVPTVMAAASRLEELRAATREERFDALLAMGRDADLVPDLDGAIGAAPFRERLRGQLMLALYRSGRQADALRAFGDARRVLADELGLESGPGVAPAGVGDPRSGRRRWSWHHEHASSCVEDDTRSGPPTNLRSSLTSFVGRQRDVAGVSDLLDHASSGDARRRRGMREDPPGVPRWRPAGSRRSPTACGSWHSTARRRGEGVAATVAGSPRVCRRRTPQVSPSWPP